MAELQETSVVASAEVNCPAGWGKSKIPLSISQEDAVRAQGRSPWRQNPAASEV